MRGALGFASLMIFFPSLYPFSPHSHHHVSILDGCTTGNYSFTNTSLFPPPPQLNILSSSLFLLLGYMDGLDLFLPFWFWCFLYYYFLKDRQDR
jgi:hypothetical protein